MQKRQSGPRGCGLVHSAERPGHRITLRSPTSFSHMATDVRSDALRTADTEKRRAMEKRASGQWLSRVLLIVGMLSIVVLAVIMASGLMGGSKGEIVLTHTIHRDRLVVTVTEQGTLESSDNTEIKCKVRGFSTVTWVIPSGTEVRAGDELVRLDTKAIEEDVSLAKTNVHTAKATLARTQANVNRSEIAIQAYLEGRFRAQMKTLEKSLVIAESNLNTAKKLHRQSEELFKKGYVTDLEVEGNAYAVTEAELELKVLKTQQGVLEQYTKEMELETLNGNLVASKSKLQADKAGLAMDEARLARALQEMEDCLIHADRDGLVIHPSAAAWKDSPDITEGATIRKDQVMLLMPDLEKMQVKVGIHESVIDRVQPGLIARVTLPDRMLEAEVSTVATVTRPAGWWTGNVVKYDTIIKLPSDEGLKPGMSAEVEIILAEHKDVLTVPVAAVLEMQDGHYCWVRQTDGEVVRRHVKLGDSNDVFIVVEKGLQEGEQVVLNPLVYVDEEQQDDVATSQLREVAHVR